MKSSKYIFLFKLFFIWLNIFLFIMPVTLHSGSGMLYLSVDATLEILMTDSQGRRSGFDPLSGEIFDEIPRTTYYEEGIGDDYLGNGDQSIHPKNILYNLDAIDGEYVIQLTNPSGEADSFSLRVDALPVDVNSDGEVRNIEGVISPDSTVIIKLTYSSTADKPIQDITVTKEPIQRIKIKDKEEEE